MSEGSELLLSVAEELKLPLMQIARLAEQGAPDPKVIRGTAESALRLLDNYILGLRLQDRVTPLELEPVSVSSVLYDTGQDLDAMAKNYGIELELNIAGRYGTVMAHREGLRSALTSLGATLIGALPALESPQLKLRLASHRSRYGIVAGLYTDVPQLTNNALKNGRRLQRQRVSRQPLTTVSPTSAAGIFVADTLLQAMSLRLRASRHQRLYGLGTVMRPNNQISLI